MIERIKECLMENLDGMDCVDCANFRTETGICDRDVDCRWKPTDAVINKTAEEIWKAINEKRFLVGIETGKFYNEDYCVSIFHESESEMQETVEYLKKRNEKRV